MNLLELYLSSLGSGKSLGSGAGTETGVGFGQTKGFGSVQGDCAGLGEGFCLTPVLGAATACATKTPVVDLRTELFLVPELVLAEYLSSPLFRD
jgi:hypothetical protein